MFFHRDLIRMQQDEVSNWELVPTALTSYTDQFKRNIFFGKFSLLYEEIPYLLLDHNVDMFDVISSLIKVWDVPEPQIILFVMSDVGPLNYWDNLKQQEQLVEGLLQASKTTEMWICTHGLDVGISKLIGDAFHAEFVLNKVREKEGVDIKDDKDEPDKDDDVLGGRAQDLRSEIKAALIGICREDFVLYPNKLTKREQRKDAKTNEKFSLNPYHSHFILINDKTFQKQGFEDFLLRFETFFNDSTEIFFKGSSSDGNKFEHRNLKIPVVTLLVEGSISCVNYVLEHLKKRLPVLVVKGSGGLADILAFAYTETGRRYQNSDLEYVDKILKPGLRDMIFHVFPQLKDRVTVNYLCERIVDCISFSRQNDLEYIYILDAHDQLRKLEDLPFHLLKSLFKSQRSDSLMSDDLNRRKQIQKDLFLILDWNCPNVAMSEVFIKYPNFTVSNAIFERVMLMKDRESFISLFLDCGFVLHKFLTSGQLLKIIKISMQENFFHDVCFEGVLGCKEESEFSEDFVDNGFKFIVQKLTGVPFFISAQDLDDNAIGVYNMNYDKGYDPLIAEQTAMSVLLTWALISNKIKLSEAFWSRSNQPVMLALIASLILSKILPFVKESGQRAKIRDQQRKFAALAIGVFSLCHKDMPCRAYDILNERSLQWRNHTVIDIATLSLNKKFVSHPCCQKWISNVFLGNVIIRDLSFGFLKFPSYMKVILGAFFIFPMYMWLRFKTVSKLHLRLTRSRIGGICSQKHARERKLQEYSLDPYLRRGRYTYPPLRRMIYLLWTAPITKFSLNNISYVIYLSLFSLAVLWPSCGNQFLDIIVCTWTALITLESAHSAYRIYLGYCHVPLFFNLLEVVYMGIFVFYYVIGRIWLGLLDPYTCKVILCVGLLYFYYRMLFIYLPISPLLGPLLYRVKSMVFGDFMNFMSLAILIIISNAFVMQATIYPDYPLNAELVRKAFEKAWTAFFITPVADFGQADSNCVRWYKKPMNETFCRLGDYVDYDCNNPGLWPYLFGVQYLVLVKLILTTVLYAVFSDAHAKLEVEGDVIWKFQRYQLIQDFSRRVCFPPPFCILNYAWFILKFFYHRLLSLFKRFTVKQPTLERLKSTQPLPKRYLSYADYNYARELVRNYTIQLEYGRKQTAYNKDHLSKLFEMAEDISYQKKIIHRSSSLIEELESNILFTRYSLQTARLKAATTRRFAGKFSMYHILSRQSPYPNTKVRRYPVPNKLVSWLVKWLNYAPTTFIAPLSEFPPEEQAFVDSNEMTLMDHGKYVYSTRTYHWNIDYTDSTGVYRNRQSWISERLGEQYIYKLDTEDLPQNPIGRTGLKGKGSLPRWGPNHYIYIIITRYNKIEGNLKRDFQFVEHWLTEKTEPLLPGGLVMSENRFQVIQDFFQIESSTVWENENDMISFFESRVEQSTKNIKNKVHHWMLFRGYMDDPLNTDQAWKEVELWHVHYMVPCDLHKSLKPMMSWTSVTKNIFFRLPSEQSSLLQEAIETMNVIFI